MKPLFFYGTLRDEALLRALLGSSMGTPFLSEPVLRPAFAPDRRAASAAGGAYPVLGRRPGARLEGALFYGVSDAALARLAAYEGPEYQLANLTVFTLKDDPAHGGAEEVEAQVFEPIAPPSDNAPDWSFEQWLDTIAPAKRHAVVELGQLFDVIAAEAGEQSDPARLDALMALWPDLMGAAAQRIGANGPLRRALGARFGREAVEERAVERVYESFFKLDHLRLRHRSLADPEKFGPELDRAVFRMGAAVGLLPYDPHTDRVALIEQFRPGPFLAGDSEPWMVEIVAGRIEEDAQSQGDPVEATARREAVEEAGLTLGRLERIDLGYASPGATDETLAFFIAEARLEAPGAEDPGGLLRLGQHGLAEEGEDIGVFSIGLDVALEALSAGEIRNLPAQLGLLWLARRRPLLQALWMRPGPLG